MARLRHPKRATSVRKTVEPLASPRLAPGSISVEFEHAETPAVRATRRAERNTVVGRDPGDDEGPGHNDRDVGGEPHEDRDNREEGDTVHGVDHGRDDGVEEEEGAAEDTEPHRTHACQADWRPVAALVTAAVLILPFATRDREAEPGTSPHPTTASRASQPPDQGVGLPGALPGNTAVKPVNVVIAFGGSRYSHVARVRETEAVSKWLASNHDHRSRVHAVRGSTKLGPRVSSAFARGVGTRLLVNVTGRPVCPRVARTLVADTTSAAAITTNIVLVKGTPTVVTVNPTIRLALANATVRAAMSVSHMRPSASPAAERARRTLAR